MSGLNKSKRLKKELKLIGVYAIATGTTLSAGFFLLPGLAAQQVGAGIVLAYLIAAIPLIPATFSIIELSTAMPRAGGIYYFMDRALGPYFGTIGGLGTWLALVLKVSFALIGMGAYIAIFFPQLPIIPIALLIALILGIINLWGAKKSGGLQVGIVFFLLILLIIFMSGGIIEINAGNFSELFQTDFDSLISTAGLVYISYVGVTNVASLSEEISSPEKNLPRGIFLALVTSIIIYGIGIWVMVDQLPMNELQASLTPVADAGGKIFGEIGTILLSVAAILAFISVANAGTMSASRYPLAMSRDHLIPKFFNRLSVHNTPVISIIFTVAVIISILLLLNPMKIAKLASAFQLMMFGLVCAGVILMRESKIDSYDPGYKSPFYPWMQIAGIIIPIYFIIQMGLLPILFSIGLITAGTIWYLVYGKNKVLRTGAIYHVFERLGQKRYHGLDAELRGILKEKGLRSSDPFEDILARSRVVDIEEETNFEEIVEIASGWLETLINHPKEEIENQLLDGTRIGATPVTHGVALPHFRTPDIIHSEMVLVRCKQGASIKLYDPLTHKEEGIEKVRALFFLVSPENNPAQHLRILAQIAGRVDEEDFMKEWIDAGDEQEMKEALLRDDKFFSLCISGNLDSKELINKQIKDVQFPEGALAALLRRDDLVIVPAGGTTLKENDRLTIIGDPKGLEELRRKYPNSNPINK